MVKIYSINTYNSSCSENNYSTFILVTLESPYKKVKQMILALYFNEEFQMNFAIYISHFDTLSHAILLSHITIDQKFKNQ